MFAAFNVSARNLYDFLNDNGTNTEVKCYEYAGFAKSFKRSSLDKVKGPLQLLNLQVFHMGRKRLAVREGKVSLKMVDDVFEWIEKNIGHLYEAFDEEFRAKIELNRADPSYSDGMLHLTNDGNLETTNQVYELTPRGVLPAQGHTSLLQGVALVITEEK
jgi:hypothetical protein